MAEGFDQSAVPARRGQRDPELAQRMLEENAQFTEGDPSEDGLVLVVQGDVILAKVTHTVPFDGKDSWFTYGLQTHVQPDETEEDAFERVATVVNNRVLDLAAAAEEAVLATQQRNRNRR